MTHLVIIQNRHSFNPFADSSKGNCLLPRDTEDYTDKRIQQRNDRKTLIQGLTDDYFKNQLVKAFKKKCCLQWYFN